MKTLLAALLIAFYGSDVSAKDVHIKNTAGGEITFSEMKGSCDDGMRLVYATSKGGEVISRGCWLWDAENERAFVVWNDGTVYQYK